MIRAENSALRGAYCDASPIRRSWVRVLAAAGLSLLSFRSEAAPPPATPPVGPEFTSVVRVLETQPIAGARLVYWDQSLADALGVRVPPGRVGQAAFERAVLERYALEVREGSARLDQVDAVRDARTPYLFVEKDAHGGAGRAGYVQVEPDVWVNIKGVGLTGEGHTAGRTAGPPSNRFSSHADGSVTLEEALKETVLSRVADAELRQGSSRVLAVIYSGRVLEYPDGRRVPLATIVRAPVTRYDQDPRVGRAIAAIGEANAKRLMKGDFVNPSNLGALGEMVDFGCMTHVCGYGPAQSSQEELFLSEGVRVVGHAHDEAMLEKIGEELLGQLGVPEAHVRTALRADRNLGERLQHLAEGIRELSEYQGGFDGRPAVPLDFKEVAPRDLHGAFRLPEFFAEAAPNYFEAVARDASLASRARLREGEIRRLLSLAVDAGEAPDELKGAARELVGDLHAALESVRRANPVADPRAYAQALREVARHKNREVDELLRPRLFRRAGELADAFVANPDPVPLSEAIEELLRRTRTGTAPGAANGIVTRADSRATEVFVRAFTDDRGAARLFAHPELAGAAPGETYHFRVTTDGWRTHHDRPARFVRTSAGDYLVFDLPHGSAAVTGEPIELAPFVRRPSGEVSWVSNGRNIRGPPLLINERLGLPADFTPERSFIEQYHGRRTRLLGDDLEAARPALGPREPISEGVGRLRSRHTAFRTEAVRSLEARADELNRALAVDARLRREFGAALDAASIPGDDFAVLHTFVGQRVTAEGLRKKANDRLIERAAAALAGGEDAGAKGFRRWTFGPAFRMAPPAVRRRLVERLRATAADPTAFEAARDAVAAGMMETPEGLAFLDELIRNPERHALAAAALAAPDLRGSPEVRPRVERLLRAPAPPPQLAEQILDRWPRDLPEFGPLLDLFIDRAPPRVLEPLIRGTFTRLAVDDAWASRVDRLVRPDGPLNGVVTEALLNQNDALRRPEAPSWISRMLAGANPPREALLDLLPRLGDLENWRGEAATLDGLMELALSADATADRGARALGTAYFRSHPRAFEWLNGLANRPGSGAALLAFLRQPVAVTTPGADALLTRLLKERRVSAKDYVSALAFGDWARHPRARRLLLEVQRLPIQDRREALLDLLVRKEIWALPGFDEWVRRSSSEPRLTPAIAEVMIERGRRDPAPEVAEALARLLRDGKFPPSTDLDQAGLLKERWVASPKFRELVELAESRGLISPHAFQGALLKERGLLTHPAAPLWIEERIRDGRWHSRGAREFLFLRENPALRIACGGADPTYACLKAAFDGGFTFRGSLASPDPALRQAMDELVRAYGQWTQDAHLRSPWFVELGGAPAGVGAPCGVAAAANAMLGISP